MAILVKGRVVSGPKEGAYFVSIYRDKLKNAVGFEPFPGTLNIECNTLPRYPNRSHFISSWTEKGKKFGAVWCYPCIILNTRGAVVVPDKTQHPKNIVEVISPYCLRTKFSLRNGDYVDVEIEEVKKS